MTDKVEKALEIVKTNMGGWITPFVRSEALATIREELERLEKELVFIKDEHDKVCDAWWVQRGLKEKAEAELERARPLLEAVAKVEIELRSWIDDSGEQVFRYNEVGDTDIILRAALAFRAARESKTKVELPEEFGEVEELLVHQKTKEPR